MIGLDGSHEEGGGQIIRTALAFSTLTGKSFSVDKIRKGRPTPGLKAQHLTCIESLERLSGCTCEGASLGSEKIMFSPGKIIPKDIEIDVGTAGSITLLMQSLLLPCMFASKRLTLKIIGGTDTKWSMPSDYFKEVFLPHLQKYCKIECKLLNRGYYPKGRGVMEVSFSQKYKLKNFDTFDELCSHIKGSNKISLIEQGKLEMIKGISHASSDLQSSNVAERQADSAKSFLKQQEVPVSISSQYYETKSTGSGITLWAVYSKDGEVNSENPVRLGSSSLGERGKSAELVGLEAAKSLNASINAGAPVDAHLADNLLPFLVFGGEFYAEKITGHVKANAYVVNEFLGDVVKIEKDRVYG